MDIYEQVLKNAKKEGRFDPRLLPWETAKMEKDKSPPLLNTKLHLPPQLLKLPQNVLIDTQKILENIYAVAKARKTRIIGFTSAVPQQGTSSLLAILALLMAARQNKLFERINNNNDAPDAKDWELPVLLVDTQFKNPSLHQKFNIQKRSGLIEMFKNEIPFNRSIKDIKSTPLKLLTSGINKNFNLTRNYLEVLSFILLCLKKKVEFIFLDIPALLSYPEAISLCRLCDGVTIVLRANETRREVLQQAKRLLENANVFVMGTIINRRKFFIPHWIYRMI
jgi:Mrp family chromosome partitioning ATPase